MAGSVKVLDDKLKDQTETSSRYREAPERCWEDQGRYREQRDEARTALEKGTRADPGAQGRFETTEQKTETGAKSEPNQPNERWRLGMKGY